MAKDEKLIKYLREARRLMDEADRKREQRKKDLAFVPYRVKRG